MSVAGVEEENTAICHSKLIKIRSPLFQGVVYGATFRI